MGLIIRFEEQKPIHNEVTQGFTTEEEKVQHIYAQCPSRAMIFCSGGERAQKGPVPLFLSRPLMQGSAYSIQKLMMATTTTSRSNMLNELRQNAPSWSAKPNTTIWSGRGIWHTCRFFIGFAGLLVQWKPRPWPLFIGENSCHWLIIVL